MKIYWSDREGNSPPPQALFHWRGFSSSVTFSSSFEQAELPPPLSVKVRKKTYLPTREQWNKKVRKALDLIQRKELQKVVLARVCILELETSPDPFAIAAALKQKAKGAFVFCLPFQDGAFLGATPERLFARKGRHILSEAMAGTCRRGKTPQEDKTLQQELFASAKQAREIFPVQTHLQNTLTPLCMTPLTFSPLSIHQTQNVQHLYQMCSGELHPAVRDEEILSSLHPTPALCGTPKSHAFSLIEELEPFERGLYGGVIGWSADDASEWIVGIRSCHLQGNIATLFSGTGIVEGSDPEEEWNELEEKLRLYDGIWVY